MHCCKSSSKKPERNYNENASGDVSNTTKKVLVWGVVIVVIVGLLVWLI